MSTKFKKCDIIILRKPETEEERLNYAGGWIPKLEDYMNKPVTFSRYGTEDNEIKIEEVFLFFDERYAELYEKEDNDKDRVEIEDWTKLEPKDLFGKQCIVTRRFIEEDDRFVGFDEGELVKIVDVIVFNNFSESLIDCENEKGKVQTLYGKDLVFLDESYYDYCNRVFENETTNHGCPEIYGFTTNCSLSCEECYKQSKYSMKPEVKPETKPGKEPLDLKPEFVPKVGDKVRILDGTGIVDYRGSFIIDMKQYIGKQGVVQKVDKEESGRVGVYLEDIGFVFDARGLELIKEEELIDGEETTKPELFPVGTVGTIAFGDRDTVYGIERSAFKSPLTIKDFGCGSYLCLALDGQEWYVPFEEFIPLGKVEEPTKLQKTGELSKQFLLDVLKSNAGLQFGYVKQALEETVEFIEKYMKDDE